MTTRNKYLLAVVPLLIVGAIFYFFSNIVIYVVVAWVLSMIGAPIVKRLRKYIGKNASAVVTLGIFVLVMTVLGYIFVPALLTQARNLAAVDYNGLVNSLEEPINDWEEWLSNRGLIESNVSVDTSLIPESLAPEKTGLLDTYIRMDSLISGVDTSVTPVVHLMVTINHEAEEEPEEDLLTHDSFFDKAKQNIYSILDPSLIPSLISNLIGGLSSFLIGLMSVFFIAFFFLREQGLFNTMISAAIPSGFEDKTYNAIEESSSLLIRYFIGVVSQIIIITGFVSLLLSILGVKNALLIGFFAALMNVIPYVGPIIGATFAVIITVSSNLAIPFYSELVPMLVKVVCVFGVMQLLDNFILQPNIFSKSVKAHPLEIFIVILVGAQIGGIGGMVLAIPVYTVLRVVAKVFLSEFKIVQQITRGL